MKCKQNFTEKIICTIVIFVGKNVSKYVPLPCDREWHTNFELIVVVGEYKVNLPDGRVQTVSYRADPVQGFVADVKYEGEAVFPPEPEEGYGANK